MRPSVLDGLEHPIVQAPMAGGPSTPELAVAVGEAGALGFLAAGYKAPAVVRDEIAAVRAGTARSFGVNLFAPPAEQSDARLVAEYARLVQRDADCVGAAVGEARHDDDAWAAKLAIVAAERVAVVSFTFGCPPEGVIDGLHRAGAEVWVTVTTPAEARLADHAGADALVVQGVEAGGHRGSFDDAEPGDIGLLALLQLVAAAVDVPLIATGGIATGKAIAAVLAAGARAAALGTALMLTPEAATSGAHRRALHGDAATGLTRAFTGRTARGIVNRFQLDHPHAPSAYPDVHYVTAPMRAAARASDDADHINLWAGQAYPLAREVPAGELVRGLAAEAREALRAALTRLTA